MLERRAEVARLRLSGVRNQTEIAERLGVSQQTISRDFIALDKEFRERAAADHATVKGLMLERIEAMIEGLWPAAATGGYLSVDRVVALMDREAKLLGLDAPVKQQTQQSGDLTVKYVVEYTNDWRSHGADPAADAAPGAADGP